MTQKTWPVLDPNSDGGTFLADELNDWVEAVVSNHKGASRPSYAVDGMIWIKAVSGTVVEIYFYDGTDDIKLGTVNPTANTFTPTGVSSGVEPGSMVVWTGSSVPSGWLLCYGQAVSRATYAALFANIGTSWGVGDGSTTFNLPDFRGRVPAGIDNMGGSAAGRLTNTVMSPDGNSLAAVGGSQTHTLSTSELASHFHSAPQRNSASGFGTGNPAAASGGSASTFNSNSSGGGNAHNNTQPTVLVNWIIKV